MFDKEKIDLIIKNNWNSESQNSIAWGLNAQNFTTQKGKKWTQASVSYYALNVLKLERKHKEFTKNIVTQEVKTQNLTEVKELDKTSLIETSLIETAVFEKQGKFFTDSLSIAKIFDKRHDHVLEAIKNCKVSENFRLTEFLGDIYFDIQGKKQPKINLTKKGFSFVAFGFTGEKADEFKEKFINRFEELENQAQQPKQQLITDPLAIMAMSIEVLRKTNEEVNKLKSDFIQTKNEFKNEIYQVSEKIINFEQRSKQAEEDLNSLPESDVLPLQRDVRMNINDAIEKYSKAFLCIPKHAWGFNYKDFERRYHMNLDARTKAAGLKHKLDYIESIGKLPELYAIILENLRNKKVGS